MKEVLDKYITYYKQLVPEATPKELSFMCEGACIKTYPKKSFFLKAGEVQPAMGFVYEGLLRRYYINEKGNTITTGFIPENNYAADYPAFIKQKASKYFIECLEASVLVELPYNKIQESYQKFQNTERYGRLIAEYVLTLQTNRTESFLFENAEERYLNFIAENQNLMHRISLTHLSSYLGIERQSLSRIRKKLTRE